MPPGTQVILSSTARQSAAREAADHPRRAGQLLRCFMVSAVIGLISASCTTVSEHRDTTVGVVGGCVAGYAACLLAKGNPTACALGCVAGAAVGGGIGAYLDNRRHRLLAAAAQAGIGVSLADVSITVANTTPQSSVSSGVTQPNTSTNGGTRSGAQEKRAPRSPNGLRADLNVAEMFALGSPQPTPAAAQKLAVVAKVYAQRGNPAISKVDTKLLITGHTDPTGTAEFNQRLSEQRARAIAGLFAANGVPAADLYVKGAGSAEPVADNDTESGRALNRRVEILEIDNEQNLLAYSVARRHEAQNLAHSSVGVSSPDHPLVSKGSSGALGGRNQRPGAAPGTNPSPPGKNLGATVQSDTYAFGGRPARAREDDVMRSIGAPPHRVSWHVSPVATAEAAEPIRACYLDQPRVDGDVFRYATGQKVESHFTNEYLPGMFGGGWGGSVGLTTIGVAPVAVLREDALPVGTPSVYIQTSAQNAPLLYPAVVNTYEGEKGLLYRVYLTGPKQPIRCFDIALPKSGDFMSPAGYVFYLETGTPTQWKQAEYRPSLMSGQSANSR